MSDDPIDTFASGFPQLIGLGVSKHGSCTTDWIGADVPKGGAEEIAALRAALVDLSVELDEATAFKDKVIELLELAGVKF